jgi:hypothetical protein
MPECDTVLQVPCRSSSIPRQQLGYQDNAPATSRSEKHPAFWIYLLPDEKATNFLDFLVADASG